MSEQSKVVATRIPESLLERLDAEVANRNKREAEIAKSFRREHEPLTRSDVLGELIRSEFGRGWFGSPDQDAGRARKDAFLRAVRKSMISLFPTCMDVRAIGPTLFHLTDGVREGLVSEEDLLDLAENGDVQSLLKSATDLRNDLDNTIKEVSSWPTAPSTRGTSTALSGKRSDSK